MSKLTRDATGYDDAKLGELLNLAGIVRHEAHRGDAEVAEDVANLEGFSVWG
jgi:hypothetical protein